MLDLCYQTFKKIMRYRSTAKLLRFSSQRRTAQEQSILLPNQDDLQNACRKMTK